MRKARIKSTLIMGALFLLIVAIVGVFTMPKYNGYDLPVLPESEYQNAYIAVSGDTAYLYFVDKQGYIQVDPDGFGNSYTLGLTTTDPYDESKILFAEKYTATIGGDSWTAEELPDLSGVYDIPAYAQFSLPCEIGGPVWSNVTLLDQDGNVFIEGTNPIDADKAASRRYSCTLGYLMALCGPVIAFPKGEPVAYSYNGVVLPKLPEMPEGFECVAVTNIMFTKVYCVFAFREPFDVSVHKGAMSWVVPDAEPYFGATYTGYETGAEGWSELSECKASSTTVAGNWLKWINYDVYTTDGELYMERTEPVPVYE